MRAVLEDMGRHHPRLSGRLLHLVAKRFRRTVAVAAVVLFIRNDLFANESLYAVGDFQRPFGHPAVIEGKSHFR